MDCIYITILLILGMILGSFYNVIGIRVPQNISFHKGRSHCPHCDTQLKYFELIPVLSYIIQGGKCCSCKTDIAIVYPITELVTGLLFAYAYIHFGLHFELLVALFFISMLLIVFVSDMHYMLIPNKILIFFLPIFLLARSFVQHDSWYNSIIGALVGYLLIAIIIIVSKGGMGAGDMKLFGVIGLVLGWQSTLLTFFLAALFGAIIGGSLLLANKIKKGQPIPFGPFIVLGALISYFYGEKLIGLYLSLL